jgi:hypothetical protein
MFARVAVLIALAAASAHADPVKAVLPALTVTPELVSRLVREEPPTFAAAAHLDGKRATRLAGVTRGHGFDSSVALVVNKASDVVGKLVGLRAGVGGFMRAENLTSSGPAAPRTVVLGLRLGMSPAMTDWRLGEPATGSTADGGL